MVVQDVKYHGSSILHGINCSECFVSMPILIMSLSKHATVYKLVHIQTVNGIPLLMLNLTTTRFSQYFTINHILAYTLQLPHPRLETRTLSSGLEWLSLTLALVGKLCVTASWAIAICFTAELYPTVIRGVGLATCTMAGQIGNVLSPIIGWLVYSLL